MDHAECFACITMLETGRFDLKPFQLRNVMALSSGDSMYITASLLRDPWESARYNNIRRMVGNIGRAGLAFLVPPVDPTIKEYGMKEWNVINHEDFDGQLQDSFTTTSLQLLY